MKLETHYTTTSTTPNIISSHNMGSEENRVHVDLSKAPLLKSSTSL